MAIDPSMNDTAFYRFQFTPSALGHLFKAVCRKRYPALMPMFARQIPRDGVVMDVGANAGQFSKMFADAAPDGQVFAFEPSSYARLMLRAAMWLTRRANVTIIPAGLSSAAGSDMLITPVRRTHSLKFGLSHLGEDATDGRALREPVVLITLDEFVSKAQLSRVDFIKVDIEGWELPMLRGAEQTLRRFKPKLYIEIYEPFMKRAGYTLPEIWNFLLALGYHPAIEENGELKKLSAAQNGNIWWLAN